MTEPVDPYLWDKSGIGNAEMAKLESLLSGFRHQPQPLEWERVLAQTRLGRRFFTPRWIWAAAAVVLTATAAVAVVSRFQWRPGEPWRVAALAGTPRIAATGINRGAQFSVGQVLETDAASRARVRVAGLGVIDVEPNSRLRLVATTAKRHRVSLDYGAISAHMWAPPFSLAVDTPSAVLFDLGCAFTLRVEPGGYGTVHVTSGWVQFETPERNITVPAGAEAVTRPGSGPGTPYFSDAPPQLRAAVSRFDENPDDASARAAAIDAILASARPRDAFTLLNLLHQVQGQQRAQVLDRMAEFVPIPAGFTRDEVLELHMDALDAYWNKLHLGDPKSWIMKWKDVLSY
jgi:hypothetical protein